VSRPGVIEQAVDTVGQRQEGAAFVESVGGDEAGQATGAEPGDVLHETSFA